MQEHKTITTYETLYRLAQALKNNPANAQNILFDTNGILNSAVREPINFLALATIFDLVTDELAKQIIAQINPTYIYTYITNRELLSLFTKNYPRAAAFLDLKNKFCAAFKELAPSDRQKNPIHIQPAGDMVTINHYDALGNITREERHYSAISNQEANDIRINNGNQQASINNNAIQQPAYITYRQYNANGQLIEQGNKLIVDPEKESKANQSLTTLYFYNAVGVREYRFELLDFESAQQLLNRLDNAERQHLKFIYELYDTCHHSAAIIQVLEANPQQLPFLLPILHTVASDQDKAKLGLVLIQMAITGNCFGETKSLLSSLEKICHFYLFPFQELDIKTVNGIVHALQKIKTPSSFLLIGYLLAEAATVCGLDPTFNTETIQVILHDAIDAFAHMLEMGDERFQKTARELLWHLNQVYGEIYPGIRQHFDKIQFLCGEKIDTERLFHSGGFAMNFFKKVENSLAYAMNLFPEASLFLQHALNAALQESEVNQENKEILLIEY